MSEKKVLICPKVSKYEWDLHRYRISHSELIKKYKNEKLDYESILLSYERQLNSRSLIKSIFPNSLIIQRDNLTKEDIRNCDITISLGGDNHFQYVSHFIDNELIFGINSDPIISEGVLLSCSTIDDLNYIKKQCDNDKYQIEKWTRLDVYLNGRYISRSTCDVFAGESERKYMSRHIIVFNGIEQQQRSSGILVSTGSGSTGWYGSASRYLNADNYSFPPSSNFAMFIVTEPYKGTLTDSTLISGSIKEDSSLKIHSLNDNNGSIILDSLEEYSFPRGSVAEIKISSFPLNVVRFDLK